MATPSSSSSSRAWTDPLKDLKSTIVFFSNDFPADDVGELFRRLHRHSKDVRFSKLNHFLSLAIQAVRDELQALPHSWQKHMPPLDDFVCLCNDKAFRKGPLGGAMEGVFLCVFQIASLIAALTKETISSHHEATNKPYDFSQASCVLAGLGCGLFAGAAASVSHDPTELAFFGAQVVRIAFRMGVHVYEASSLLEAPQPSGVGDDDQEAESWAYVIPGTSADLVQEEIEAYNKNSTNSKPTSVFISAADQTSVSVSGPPSRLKAFLKGSEKLRFTNFFSLPVHHGLCHAPHIYSSKDVDAILGDTFKTHCTGLQGSRYQVLSPLLSSETGEPFESATFDGLVAEVVEQLLTRKIHLDNISGGLYSILKGSPVDEECALYSFRSSLVLKAICANIEARPGAPRLVRCDLVDATCEEAQPRTPRTPKEAKLAVVGMSCRMPGGANDHELYWKLMAEGRDVHTTVPPDRFDLKTHYDPTGQVPNSTPTPYMCYMDNPGHFDPGFFNMSPREALETDPMHRLALVTAYEALEMSGYSPNRTRSTSSTRVGTFYGQASDDWRELNGSQNIGSYAVPGGERGFANGRIQYFFKFSGPSFNIDTACSSGLAAVNAACSSLWAGDTDMAIAGGLNVITDPDNFCQLGSGYFLSRTGQCKVWDAAADGYCRADGVGSVVLKRLEDAEADNDNIIAVILSAATNHSADAASITQPHAPTQVLNYKNVMARAGVNPLDVSYVELHGTGTQVGDREESRSVAEVFAPLTPQKRRKSQKLRVGSVKSNIGHGEAAAGIASMIKLLLMYQKGHIPPHIGVKNLNPALPQDMDSRNMFLNTELSEWQKPAQGPRYSIVNSFGAHGGNTTVLFEDPPERVRPAERDPRALFPFTISARSRNSLKMNIRAMLEFLDGPDEFDLGDLSYTLCARRMHHPLRIAGAFDDVNKLRKFLTKKYDDADMVEPIPLKSPPVIFVFTGQGAFYSGIGRQLYDHFPIFSAEVDRLDGVVQELGFPSVLPWIDGSASGDVSPVVSQLAIVVVEIALLRFWNSMGVYPSAVLGHSLGEYAAFVAAGTLSVVDALFLAGSRATLLMDKCKPRSHNMLAVRAPLDDIEALVGAKDQAAYDVSCFNTERDTVISGEATVISEIAAKIKNAGIKCTLLDVGFAFHSAQTDPILKPFEELAGHVNFNTPNIPVISPLLSECIFDGKTLNAKYLSQATREPVDFVGALDAARELGIEDPKTVWIELGPHFIAGHFVKDVCKTDRVVPSIQRDVDNFATIGTSLAWLHDNGVSLVWNEYFRPYEKAHKLLTLKSYKWNNKDYWIPYLGSWTLDKAHIKENLEKMAGGSKQTGLTTLSPKLKTSLIHGILSESAQESKYSITTLSNLLDPAFLEAVRGHIMNNHGVATSSIWADMAFTVGSYLLRQAVPQAGSKGLGMSVNNMLITEGQVAKSTTPQDGGLQLLQLEGVLDTGSLAMSLQLYNASDDGTRAESSFGSCSVQFEDPAEWRREWRGIEHLVLGRIEALEAQASAGKANRLTRNMAYTLFSRLVNYADRYRGMRSVVMHDYEACANITLSEDEGGIWHTPPHWIDSVAHLAGLIMNGSDASNTTDYFYITPGWQSLRFAEPLEAGASYRNYVKMMPTEDKGVWAGDVYIFRGDIMIGMVGQIRFRQYPRLLLDRFFSANKAGHASAGQQPQGQLPAKSLPQPAHAPTDAPTAAAADNGAQKTAPPAADASPAPAPKKQEQPESSAGGGNPIIAGAINLIASEAGLDPADLKDDTLFSSVGVDSLMSLVLVEKFKAQMSLEMKSSVFLECETVGEFKEWLADNR